MQETGVPVIEMSGHTRWLVDWYVNMFTFKGQQLLWFPGWMLIIMTFIVQFALTLGKSSSNVWKFDERTSLSLKGTAEHKATNVYASLLTLHM